MTGDRVRDEAERLVAAALTAISTSLRAGQAAGTALATGSAECCICPVCRAIAAVRDPNSDLADRLAAGVGDLATGVATLLRVLSARGERVETPESASDTGGHGGSRPGAATNTEWWEDLRRKAADAAQAYARRPTRDPEESTVDDPWRVATREQAAAEEPASASPSSGTRKATVTKAAARKAAARAAASARTAPARTGAPAHTVVPAEGGTAATRKVAKKAVATKAAAPKAVAKKTAAPGGAA